MAKLREMGEDVPEEAAAEAAAKSRQTFALADWWPFRDRAWRHTRAQFRLPAGRWWWERRDILGVGEVEADVRSRTSAFASR